MKKRLYSQPTLTALYPDCANMIADSLHKVEGNANLRYGGGGNQDARVKEQHNYNVWDDNWSN